MDLGFRSIGIIGQDANHYKSEVALGYFQWYGK